jgi:hypothetical protein
VTLSFLKILSGKADSENVTRKGSGMRSTRTGGMAVFIVVAVLAQVLVLTNLLVGAETTGNLVAGSRFKGAKLMAAGTKMIYSGWKILNKGLEMRKQSEMSSDFVKLKEGASEIVEGTKTLSSEKDWETAKGMMLTGRRMLEDAQAAIMKLPDKLESTKLILEGAAMILKGERMVVQGREMLMQKDVGKG